MLGMFARIPNELVVGFCSHALCARGLSKATKCSFSSHIRAPLCVPFIVTIAPTIGHKQKRDGINALNAYGKPLAEEKAKQLANEARNTGWISLLPGRPRNLVSTNASTRQTTGAKHKILICLPPSAPCAVPCAVHTDLSGSFCHSHLKIVCSAPRIAPKNINSPPAAPAQGPLVPLKLRPCPAAALFEPKKIARSRHNPPFVLPSIVVFPLFSQPNEQKKKMAQKALPANPVRNKLAESENRPLNQTFTIAKQKPSPVPLRRNRANSFDSDFADFGPGKWMFMQIFDFWL